MATIQDFIARRQPEEGEEDKAEETEIEQKVDTEENKETKKQSGKCQRLKLKRYLVDT